MRELAVTVALVIWYASPSSAESNAYPTPHNQVLEQLVQEPQAWHGKFIGVEGTLLETEPGPLGKPLLKISARGPNAKSVDLWVGSLVKPPNGWLAPGHVLKLAGFFTFIAPPPDANQPADRLTNGYHLLAQCVVNVTTGEALALPAGRHQCERWLQGEHPERLASRP